MEPSYTSQVMSIRCYPHVCYWGIYCVLRCHCRRLHKGALNTFSVNHCTGLFINFLRILFWYNSWLANEWFVGNESAKENIWDLSGFSTKALISIYYSTIISIHNAEWRFFKWLAYLQVIQNCSPYLSAVIKNTRAVWMVLRVIVVSR